MCARRDILKLDTIVQFIVDLNLVESSERIDEPTAQPVPFKLLRVCYMVLIPFDIRVDIDNDVKYVKNGLTVVVESSKRQVISLPIAQPALLP